MLLWKEKFEEFAKQIKRGWNEGRNEGKQYGRFVNDRRDGAGPFDRRSSWRQVCILTGIFLAAIYMSVGAAERSILQQGIAEEVLRFHVLANSDSEADQAVKYRVRDAVLEWMSQEIQRGSESDYESANCVMISSSSQIAESSQDTENEKQKEKVMSFAQDHLEDLELVADQILAENDMDYQATAEIVRCYFPDRTYGDYTFPAGWYEALRIRLGEAEGQNWWCILYPQLCFQDCLHAVVEEEQLQELEEMLTVEEYESLLQKPQKWKLALRWF